MKLWLFWLFLPIVLVVIACLKVGVYVSYCEAGLSFKVLVGKLRLQVGRGDEDENQQVKQASKPKRKKKSRMKAWLKAALGHWREILELIGRILSAPTLEKLELRIIVGGSDPEKCAMTYGHICGLVGAMLPVIENTFDVKKRHIDVQCSFEMERVNVSAEAAATLKIYEIVVLAVAILKLLLQLRSQAKSYYESGADV